MSGQNHNTVNSRLVDTPLLQTLAIADKIQIPIYSGLTENDSRYSGLLLFWTQNKRHPEGVRYNESWLYVYSVTPSLFRLTEVLVRLSAMLRKAIFPATYNATMKNKKHCNLC